MLCSQLFTHALLALSLTLATPQESWGMITAGGGGYAAQSFSSKKPYDLPQQQKKNNYTLFNIKKNWDDAKKDCIERGMEFATIMNDAENEEVVKLITDSGNGHDDVNYWISGKYVEHELVFLWWPNGEDVIYNKWHRSVKFSVTNHGFMDYEAPTCSGGLFGTCIEINGRFNNEWTVGCHSVPQYYICKSRR